MSPTEKTDNNIHEPEVTETPRLRPFVAPCRQLTPTAPLRWLKQGWQDFKQAPLLSMVYGSLFMLASWVIALWSWQVGSFTMLIVLFSAFVFLGPALAMGLYSVSCQLDRGMKPRIGFCLKQGRKRLGNQLVFAFALLVIFLVWARAAAIVNIFLPMARSPDFSELLTFLIIGSVVGLLFTLIVYAASVFSLPMIMDRDVDAITAVLSSINAVLKNKAAMLLWALIILGSVLVGFLTLFLGFIVTLPVIGYASWRGYRETIIGDEWQQDPETAA
ncbi:DUF2189 domain-containing protein [Thiothrix litoralis]|jgi:uncharacterized membrane protein|uniref:DUF2189 domain-containing protein n=1 Tax=Thiothrix litoralis TaxID=2891210 RepID=A0ABX7WUW8_9GAMM|nr:DUF2189 domain-containing protein [Thiothrix litoralis]QTR47420.1 DUF2189 domain-containing protein [Thiothrix litoralis]